MESGIHVKPDSGEQPGHLTAKGFGFEPMTCPFRQGTNLSEQAHSLATVFAHAHHLSDELSGVKLTDGSFYFDPIESLTPTVD